MPRPTAPDRVVVRAPAKVNLGLWVGPRRDDGFHELATVFHAVDLIDEVTVTPAQDWACVVRGRGADLVPTGDDNLAIRAGRAAVAAAGVAGACRIEIDKQIPVAGGMAGGSADAAAALAGVDVALGLGLDKEELLALAAELGSDIPFSVTGGTALGRGRGDRIAPVLARGSYHWVFALHHDGLSTPRVYAECDRLRDAAGEHVPDPEPSARLMSALRTGDPQALGAALHNDLQPAAISLLPRIRRTLDAGLAQGALGGVVSGSGPTVAFLTADRKSALDLMVALSADGAADDVVSACGPVHGAQVVGEAGPV